MRDNTENAVRLLRGIADAIEQDRASFADYKLYDSIEPHGQ